MMLVIKSDNESFSHLLGKNPASLPKFVSIRKGMSVGWYDGDHTYCVKFMDKPEEVSFAEGYEYLSPHQYCHPAVALNCLDGYMTLNTEYDKVAHNYIAISGIFLKEKTQRAIQSHFSAITISPLSHRYENYCHLEISQESTLESTLNKLYIVLLLALIHGHENEFIHHEMILKYAKKFMADIPYFIRYLFKVNCLRSNNIFQKCKQYLDTESINMVYGSLAEQRVKFILENIKDKNVIDFGCGEGRYANRLLGQNLSYTGVDIDNDTLEQARKKRNEDCKFIHLDDLVVEPRDQLAIVCSEMIEHVDWNELSYYFQIFRSFQPELILFTTPNSDFNKHYCLEDEMRHDDHIWEKPTSEVFERLNFEFNNKYSIYYVPIGDLVDNQSSSQGYILVKK